MKNYIRIVSVLTCFLLFVISSQAQNSIPASGGDATGTNGSSSYTVGQVVYTTIHSETGSSAQGVQHPYQIDIISGIDESTIQLEIIAYPNPTTHWINIQVQNFDQRKLDYQLFDVTGKLMNRATITESNTTIEMQNLAAATYLLSISDKNEIVKTFKIIKSN